MNTYIKYAPNVYIAICDEKHEKGETIKVTTRRGKDNECIVFNLIGKTVEGKYAYSIVRADGFNAQEWAKRRAERYSGFSENATARSNKHYDASHEGRDFLSLGQPILIGHHSEKRHRSLIERNNNRMRKSIEESKKAEEYKDKADYWERKANTINSSMPESLEYYKFKLKEAREYHEGLKSGKYEREHSFDLGFARKDVRNLEKKLKLAQKLFG